MCFRSGGEGVDLKCTQVAIIQVLYFDLCDVAM